MGHTGDRLCFCSEVFVVFDGRVLLRVHDKYGFWLSIGGHIEPGEDPVEAAVREVKEEVGLDVELFDGYVSRAGCSSLVPPRFLSRHRVSASHEHVAHVFFARAVSDVLCIPSSESAVCRWFSLEDLDSSEFDIKPDVKFFAKCALREVV